MCGGGSAEGPGGVILVGDLWCPCTVSVGGGRGGGVVTLGRYILVVKSRRCWRESSGV